MPLCTGCTCRTGRTFQDHTCRPSTSSFGAIHGHGSWIVGEITVSTRASRRGTRSGQHGLAIGASRTLGTHEISQRNQVSPDTTSLTPLNVGGRFLQLNRETIITSRASRSCLLNPVSRVIFWLHAGSIRGTVRKNPHSVTGTNGASGEHVIARVEGACSPDTTVSEASACFTLQIRQRDQISPGYSRSQLPLDMRAVFAKLNFFTVFAIGPRWTGNLGQCNEIGPRGVTNVTPLNVSCRFLHLDFTTVCCSRVCLDESNQCSIGNTHCFKGAACTGDNPQHLKSTAQSALQFIRIQFSHDQLSSSLEEESSNACPLVSRSAFGLSIGPGLGSVLLNGKFPSITVSCETSKLMS